MARARLLSLVVALVTLVLYLPVRHYAFVNFDDPEYITQNRIVMGGLTWAGVKWAFRSLGAGYWHPLTWLSHEADCELFGLDAGAHHLVSAILHAANAGVLCFLLFRMTGAPWASALVAALFAWHPLRVESVAWVAERKDVLSTLFLLLTLWAYARHAGVQSLKSRVQSQQAATRNTHLPSTIYHLPSSIFYPLSLLFFVLGLMSKPMLVTLPLVLLLLDYWPLRRLEERQKEECRRKNAEPRISQPVSRFTFHVSPTALLPLLLEKVPFFALGGACSLLTYWGQKQLGALPLEAGPPLNTRAANGVVSCAWYLVKTLWPSHLAVYYPYPDSLPPWQVAGGLVLLAGVTAAALVWRRQRPWLLVGWAWYVVTLLPVIGLIQVGSHAMADRYTYVPQIGIFIALVFEARYWAGRWRLGWVAPALLAGGLLAGCLVMTVRQLTYWKDSQSLFTRALAVTRDNAKARVNLGLALETLGKPQEALIEYQAALLLDPGLAQVHNNLGNVLTQLGRHEEALVQFRESLRLEPRPLAFLNLGALLARLGKTEEALSCYTEAARSDPRDPAPHLQMGRLSLQQGHSTAALVHFRDALRLDPNDVQSLICLARVLAAEENPAIRNGPEALASALRANLLTEGRDPLVLDALAMAYAENSRFADAQDALRAALDRAQLTGETNAVPAMRQRLELYRSGQPFRGASANLNTERF